jgi:hypothetical protein
VQLAQGRADTREDREDIFVRASRAIAYVGVAFVLLLHFKITKGLNLSDGIFAIAAILLLLSRRPPKPAPRTPAWYVGAFLFVLAWVAASINSDYKALSLLVVFNAIYVFFVLQYLLRQLLDTRERIQHAMVAYIVGATVSAFVCILQVGLHILTFAPSGPGAISGGDTRAIGLSGQPDFAGVSFALGIVFSLGLLVERGWHRKRWLVACIVVMVVADLLTGSVGGFATTLVGCFALFIVQGFNLRTVFAVLLSFAFVYVLVFSVIDPGSNLNLIARIEATTHANGTSNSGTLQLRIDTIKDGWDGIVQSPILGHGLDQTTLAVYYDQFLYVHYPPHNMIILYWFGGGIFMLVGVLIMMGSSVNRLVSGGRLRGKNKDTLRATVFAACILVVFFSLQAPSFIDRWLWFVFILGLCFRDPAVPAPEGIAELPVASARPRRVVGTVGGRGNGEAVGAHAPASLGQHAPADRGRHAAPGPPRS